VEERRSRRPPALDGAAYYGSMKYYEGTSDCSFTKVGDV